MLASVNYSINQQTAHALYKTVGKNYYDNIVLPRILENIKAVFAQYSAENLIANRESLSEEIVATMREDMTEYGINIISTAYEGNLSGRTKTVLHFHWREVPLN